MNRYGRLAERLRAMLPEDQQTLLAENPAAALGILGIQVGPLQLAPDSIECSCDGVYFPGSPGVIGYTPTPGSRRERFTLVHECAHVLIRHNNDVLSMLADMGDDGGVAAKERVCDTFAGSILVPAAAVDQVLGGERPAADHLAALYRRTQGSREACCVRLAERLPGFGYVAIGDPSTHTIRFASPSPSNPYAWRRGTALPDRHPLWRAAAEGAFRGEGRVLWPSGESMNLWIHAVREASEVHAVFSEHRFWDAPGVSIPDGASRPARPIGQTGTCRHCGAHTWGYRACPACGDVRCRDCGRCGCGAPAQAPREERTCSRCQTSKRSHLFRQGSDVCIDCE